ncbi:hypothetical protein J31TS4_30630 [Paenibacillus sp. J31TS4]|nr:hypothetical protein J31TS4_30630 [Paenibacillus sp. J31TS4]
MKTSNFPPCIVKTGPIQYISLKQPNTQDIPNRLPEEPGRPLWEDYPSANKKRFPVAGIFG